VSIARKARAEAAAVAGKIQAIIIGLLLASAHILIV
jgi:hypothetical protein